MSLSFPHCDTHCLNSVHFYLTYCDNLGLTFLNYIQTHINCNVIETLQLIQINKDNFAQKHLLHITYNM